MATLAHGGRINVADVNDEVARLNQAWSGLDSSASSQSPLTEVLSDDQIAALDLFDRAQLATVLGVCRQSSSLSEAGRKLFAVSRLAKAQPNDADRLRKYLASFSLAWSDVTG
jgi:transcriptional regulatory protein RtcR